MKFSQVTPSEAPDGTEQIVVLQGIGPARDLKLMSPTDFAAAGTRWTNAELTAAVLDAIVQGTGMTFTADAEAGTVTISIDTASLATTAALNAGLEGKQAAAANLTALAGLALGGNGGKVIKVNAAGDGFELAIDLQANGGTGLPDGTFGDVTISNGGTKMTVTVTEEAYGPGWNNDSAPPTKNSLWNKLEALGNLIGGKVSAAAIGVANGVAGLGADGKVPAAQLPSYVDDVLEFSSTAAFPAQGEAGKIYVALDTGRQSRWGGSAYVELTASPGSSDAVPEGAVNKYYTGARVRAEPMTGLIDTVGAPAPTDSLLTVLGKLKREAFRALSTNDLLSTGAVILGGDGGIEIGSFVDFHSPNNDGRDFAARLNIGVDNGAFCFYTNAPRLFLNGNSVATVADLNGGLAGKLDKTGGVINGGIAVKGDVTADRGDGTGVIFFGNTGSKYLYWDNQNYQLPGAGLFVGGNITSSSDRRLKSDIRPLDGASSIVAALQAYRFTMHDKPSVGLIAQEVQEVLPELVGTDADGMLGVDYSKLTAVLIADNNALRAELAELKAAVAELQQARA